MPGQKQATETKPNKETKSAREPAASTELVAESSLLAADPTAASPFDGGDLGSAGQAVRLRDPRLQTAQRRSMASRIGQLQGNQHLQRLLDHQPLARPRANGHNRGIASASFAVPAPVQRDNGDTEGEGTEAQQIARQVYEALHGWNDEAAAIRAIQGRAPGLRTEIQNEFRREYRQDLRSYFRDQLSGDWLVKAFALLRSTNIHEPHTAMALALIPTGTRDAEIFRILQGLRTPELRRALEHRYNETFADIGEGSLVDDLKGDLSGWRLEKSLALMHRNLKSADHLYFDSVAITGTHTSSVISRIQSEWDRGPAQFAAFERDWDQYVRNQSSWSTEPAWTELPLREAMQSELSGEAWELVSAVLDGHRAYQRGATPTAGPQSEEQLRQQEELELRVAERTLTAATEGGYTGVGTNEQQVFRAVQAIQRVWQRRIDRTRKAGNTEQLAIYEASWNARRQQLLITAAGEMNQDSADFRRVQLLTMGNLTPADEVYLAGEALDYTKVGQLVTKYWAQGGLNKLLADSQTTRNDESGATIRPRFDVAMIVPSNLGLPSTRVASLAHAGEEDGVRGARRLKLELDQGNDDSDLKRGLDLLKQQGISAGLRSSTIQAFATQFCGGQRGSTPVHKFLNYISTRYSNSATCWEFRDMLAPATDPAEMLRRARGRLAAQNTGWADDVLNAIVGGYEALTGEDTQAVTVESLERLQFIARQAGAKPDELEAMMMMTGALDRAALARMEYAQFTARLNDLRSLKRTIANTLATIVELTVEAVITVATGGAAAAAFVASLSAAVAGMVTRELLLGQQYDLLSEENARTLAASLAGHAFGPIGRRAGDTVLGPEELRQLSRIRTFMHGAITDGFQQAGQQTVTIGLEHRAPTVEEIAGRAITIAGSGLSAGARSAVIRTITESTPAIQRLRTNVVASMTQNISSAVADQAGTFVRSGIGNRSWADIAVAFGQKAGQGAFKGLTSGIGTVGGERVAAGRAERAAARAEGEETTEPAASPAQTSRESTGIGQATPPPATGQLPALVGRAQQLAMAQIVPIHRKPDRTARWSAQSLPASNVISRIPMDMPPMVPLTERLPSPVSVASVIKSKSPTLVRRLTDDQIASASIKDRISLIRQVANQTWVGVFDERQIERIYRTFESKGELQGVLQLKDGVKLWDYCINKGADLDDFETIKNLKAKFRNDVKYQAKQYLNKNRKHAVLEMASVGLSPDGSAVGELTALQRSRLDEMKAIAKEIRLAQLARDALRRIPVARVREPTRVYGLKGPAAHAIEKPVYVTRTAYFSPNSPPVSFTIVEETKTPWRDVKKTHDELTTTIATFSNRFPTIYALIRDNKLDEMLSAADGAQAQRLVGSAMQNLIRNIDETMPKIDPEDLHWEELAPIHAQLFGKKVPSTQGIDWSLALNKWAGNDAVKDYKDAKFWRSLGLGTLAAAAFIVAEIASFGTATFFIAAGLGLGATGLQAGLSWENYEDMAKAADTSVSDQLAIVAKSDVSAALLDAILDTAFGLLDVYGLGKAIRAGRAVAKALPLVGEAVAAGARKTVIPTMIDVTKKGAADLVERSLADLGIEETVKRTGRSAKQLADLLAASGTKAHRKAAARVMEYEKAGRAFAAAGRGTVEELLPKLGSLSREHAEQVVILALGKYGPRRTLERSGGWKHLITILGKKGSKAGSELERWRHALYRDLEKYIRALPDGDLRRTGTWGFGHDMDISILGPRASEYEGHARSFLAGRVGTSPAKLRDLLYFDVFTDPRRMHLYDLLEEGARRRIAKETAAFEDQLVWNQRLYNARTDEYLAAKIRADMKRLRIEEIKGYKPLTPKDLPILKRRIDKLHKRLESAVTAGDAAKQERLVREISVTQAQINAAEGGGYLTGGGVRRYASERPGEVKPMPGLKGEKLPSLRVEHLGAVHDQIVKLQEAAADLTAAITKMSPTARPSPVEIAAALKAIGKYGERFNAEVVAALGLSIPKKGIFDDMAATFRRLVSKAEAGTLTREAASGTGSLLVKDASIAIAELDMVSAAILHAIRRGVGVAGVKISAADIRLYTLLHVRFVRCMHLTYSQLRRVVMEKTFWKMRTAARLTTTTARGGGKKEAPAKAPGRPSAVHRKAAAEMLLHERAEDANRRVDRSPQSAASAQRQPLVTPLPPPTFAPGKFVLLQPRFNAEYVPVGPIPAEGTLQIMLKVHIKYQQLTRAMLRKEPYNNYRFTPEQKRDMGWKAAEKTRFASDFQSSVRNAWSAKHKLALMGPAFSNYRCSVGIKVEVVTDASKAHTRITALKVPKGAPRYRSYVSGKEAFLDIRDPTQPETHQGSLTHYVRQVGPFGFNKAELTPALRSQTRAIAGDLRPMVDPANQTEVLSDRYIARFHGRASAKGSRRYNERLGLRRAAAVAEDLATQFSKPPGVARRGSKGEEHATEDERFQRVDVIIEDYSRGLDTEAPERRQNVAAHEAGHMLGIGDEYIDEKPSDPNVLPKFAGDQPTHYGDVKSLVGAEEANELLVRESGSIMAQGSTVAKGHYVYFVKAINRMTGKKWSVE